MYVKGSCWFGRPLSFWVWMFVYIKDRFGMQKKSDDFLGVYLLRTGKFTGGIKIFFYINKIKFYLRNWYLFRKNNLPPNTAGSTYMLMCIWFYFRIFKHFNKLSTALDVSIWEFGNKIIHEKNTRTYELIMQYSVVKSFFKRDIDYGDIIWLDVCWYPTTYICLYTVVLAYSSNEMINLNETPN